MKRRGAPLLALCLLLACAPGSAGTPPAGGAPGGGERTASAPAGAPPAMAEQPYLARPGETPTPVRVVTCAVSGGYIHLYTALEGDLFTKYGLQVEQVSLPGSTAALAALTANEAQFLYCAADATIPGLASGIDARIVGSPLVGLVWVMIGRPEIRTVADLRGKAIGIPRVGALADRLSRLALERHGLRPNEDVDIRPIGGSQPERYQALLASVVQGT